MLRGPGQYRPAPVISTAMTRLALALIFTLALAVPAHATELGVQDDGRDSATVCQAIDQIGGTWTRTTVALGQDGVAQRIRDAHACGKQIILTIGGTGTGPKDSATRKPTAKALLAYIRSLPRADKYTVINEPDLSGIKACTYRRIWGTVRKVLGSRLLFGDFSSHAPLTYTQRVANCRGQRRLPKIVDFAIHPYWPGDPLVNSTPVRLDGDDYLEGGLGQLVFARKWLKKNAGIRVRWWIDEFGYLAATNDDVEAWLWSRARRKATAIQAKVLIAYTATNLGCNTDSNPDCVPWNTRPGPVAWCYLTSGLDCPSPTVEHRVPAVVSSPDPPGATIRLGDVMTAIKEYAGA